MHAEKFLTPWQRNRDHPALTLASTQWYNVQSDTSRLDNTSSMPSHIYVSGDR